MSMPPFENSHASNHDSVAPTLHIPLIAGYRPDGEGIVEQVAVTPLGDDDKSQSTKSVAAQYRLLRSPAFVRGLAAGDKISFPADTAEGYELLQRSGNLCLRVLSKSNIDEVLLALTPEIELLDGVLDIETPRLLVYSIHVSIGFQAIEILLDRISGQFAGTLWYYGNVYDPADGVTPLDWWQAFLAPV
tara:strand:+ start:508 stop:1074 length:567 start_codon:yes stop_codon:yes gene_type:complete